MYGVACLTHLSLTDLMGFISTRAGQGTIEVITIGILSRVQKDLTPSWSATALVRAFNEGKKISLLPVFLPLPFSYICPNQEGARSLEIGFWTVSNGDDRK